jgi:DHA2 family multidrug resistance protein-like MFS transporter
MPAEVADAVRSTLGGAVAVAAQLPIADGAKLLQVARAAFAHSFAVTAWISAAIAIATAMASAILLRHVGADSAGRLNPEHRLDPTEDATTADRGGGTGSA